MMPLRWPLSMNRRRSDVLVVQYTGSFYRAAVVRADQGGELGIDATAESRAILLADALSDLIGQLQRETKPLPREVVFQTVHAQSTVLELPVHPSRPLPPAEMQSLIKWELTPYMTRQRSRRIGAIMVDRGYLSAMALDQLLEKAKAVSENASHRPTVRLGDLAKELGLIDSEALEDCLAVQRSMQDYDDEPVCGWVSVDVPAESDGDRWRWLVCGTPRSYRNEVVDAFGSCSMCLRGLYPLVGCAAAFMNGQLGGDDTILEYHEGQLCCQQWFGERLHVWRNGMTHGADNPLDICMEMVNEATDRIWLAGHWPDVRQAAEQLQVTLARSCQPIQRMLPGVVSVDEQTRWHGVYGAAHDFLTPEKHPNKPARIAPADPVTPMYRRRPVQVGVLAVAVALLLAGLAWHASSQRRSLQAVQTAGAAVSARRKSLKHQAGRLQAMKKQVVILGRQIPRRVQLLPRVLSVLESTCPQEITIDCLQETDEGQLMICGWGLTAEHVQSFRVALQQHLNTFQPVAGDRPIREKTGGDLPAGYVFEIRLKHDGPRLVHSERTP